MPYTHKKVGNKYVVYKKGKKVGETEGTKTALNKYLAALHIADKKESIKESVEEGQLNEAAFANNFTFWVVEKSKSPSDNPLDLVFETDPIGFANQVRGGLMPENIYGFYLEESEAQDAAHDQVQAVFEAAKAMEEKKTMVTTKIEEVIKKLQEKVNRCMEEGRDEEAQMHLEKISQLRLKGQMVEASKKPIEDKKDIKESEVDRVENLIEQLEVKVQKVVNRLKNGE